MAARKPRLLSRAARVRRTLAARSIRGLSSCSVKVTFTLLCRRARCVMAQKCTCARNVRSGDDRARCGEKPTRVGRNIPRKIPQRGEHHENSVVRQRVTEEWIGRCRSCRNPSGKNFAVDRRDRRQDAFIFGQIRLFLQFSLEHRRNWRSFEDARVRTGGFVPRPCSEGARTRRGAGKGCRPRVSVAKSRWPGRGNAFLRIIPL